MWCGPDAGRRAEVWPDRKCCSEVSPCNSYGLRKGHPEKTHRSLGQARAGVLRPSEGVRAEDGGGAGCA